MTAPECVHRVNRWHTTVALDYSVGKCVFCGKTVALKTWQGDYEQPSEQQNPEVSGWELGQAGFGGAEIGREVFGLAGDTKAPEPQAKESTAESA